MVDIIKEDELTLLKSRATKMGITFHPNIGLEKLRIKVNGAIKTEVKKASVSSITDETSRQRNQRLRKEASVLRRIRVTCMNPNKKSWEGEILTVSNSVVGTHKKYIPFNAENGWHVPQIIVGVLQERQCQTFYKAKVNGKDITKSKLIKEFVVEILDPLTLDELDDLKTQQAMANNIG